MPNIDNDNDNSGMDWPSAIVAIVFIIVIGIICGIWIHR